MARAPRPLAALAGVAAAALAAPVAARAEVVQAGPSRFELSHAVVLDMTPQEAWRRLVRVEAWWSDEHTYSGSAANLSLGAEAGGCWCERWGAGSVEHGRVLVARPGVMLRLDAAFGPLQALSARGTLTFALAPLEQAAEGPARTRLTMTYVVSSDPESALDRLAPVVDGVMVAQLNRLAGTP